MPSFDHEFLVELFRNEGRLAVELLRSCAGIAIDHTRVERATIDLSQVAPTEYRADAVAILHGSDDRSVLGIVVEIQRHIDPRKLLTWPVYVATLCARFECPVVLLIVAPDPGVAAWARRPIDLGHPGFQLTPIVISFDEVPWVDDRAAALQLPELAVLSALAHPSIEVADAAIAAIAGLPEDRKRLYLDVVLAALPAAAREILEHQMQGYQYRSDFARKYYGEGHEEGRLAGLRTAVVAIAQARFEELPAEDVGAINAVPSASVLTELMTSLLQARSSAEARRVLDHALGR
jgi:hypothetical protein